jgi:hypothetical protein
MPEPDNRVIVQSRLFLLVNVADMPEALRRGHAGDW